MGPLLKLRPTLTTATATELASVATTEELATVALTEATVATLGATGPTEATMARERLSPRLLPKLKLTLTTAPTAMVDTDCLTDAPTVDTAFLTVAGTVATDSPTAADCTAAATTERGKLRLRLRLTPPSARGVRTRGGPLTGAATATATATATSPPTPGATPDPTQSPTGPTVPAATALLTTATTTERRKHLTDGLILIYMN